MKVKTPLLRSIVIVVILVLSVVIGLIYNGVWKKIDTKLYPREYSEFVEKYSEEYAVPEYLIYAVIKTESDFQSGAVGEDGGIGLMGITIEEFDDMLRVTKENLTHDALYGPETNIKYGTYRLSRLYNMFEKWAIVCSASYVDEATAEAWLNDESNYSDDGVFESVPDKNAIKLGKRLYECAEKYSRMYYGG